MKALRGDRAARTPCRSRSGVRSSPRSGAPRKTDRGHGPSSRGSASRGASGPASGSRRRSSRRDRNGRARGPATRDPRGLRPPEPARGDPAAPGLPGASPSRHLLHLEFRKLERVFPLGRDDATVLVVPREAPNLRFDELQAPLVAQVLPVFLQVRLEARGPSDQARKVLRQSELGAFRPQDLQQAASGREPHARDAEAVPEAHTDRGGGEAFLVQTENRLLDIGLLHRDPLRVRLEKRPRGSALSFAMRMEASHHFLGRGCAYRGDICKIHLARATAMMRNVFRDTGRNPFFTFVAANVPRRLNPPRRNSSRMPRTVYVWIVWSSSNRSSTRPAPKTKKRNSTGSRPVRGPNRASSRRTISMSFFAMCVHVWNGDGRAAGPCQNSNTKKPFGSRWVRMLRRDCNASRCVNR